MRHAAAPPASPRPRTWRRRDRMPGFTLFEVVLVILLMTALFAVLFGRSRHVQEQAEKAAMEQTVAALRRALALKSMTLTVAGRTAELAALAAANPMTLLDKPLENDAGAFYGPDGEDIPSGNWYYDRGRHELVYLVRQAAHFHPADAGRPAIRFRIAPVPGATGHPASDKREAGLTLVESHPFQWEIGPTE